MLKPLNPILIIIIFLIACNKKNSDSPCQVKKEKSNQTTIQIAENLFDSAYATNDTVTANELVTFLLINPYHASVSSVNWNINNGGDTSTNQNFQVRFKYSGDYEVTLVVSYQPQGVCSMTNSFSDTVTETVHVLNEDRSSKLLGTYVGFVDSNSSKPLTISINYFKLPGDDIGGYYLYNYVQGCTGDGINSHIPNGTGYEIISGFKNFSIPTYPCAAPSDFKGFGYLNSTDDSLTIEHYGYISTDTKQSDPPAWHMFKGKRQ